MLPTSSSLPASQLMEETIKFVSSSRMLLGLRNLVFPMTTILDVRCLVLSRFNLPLTTAAASDTGFATGLSGDVPLSIPGSNWALSFW